MFYYSVACFETLSKGKDFQSVVSAMTFKIYIEFRVIQYIILLPEVAKESLLFLNCMKVWVVYNKSSMKNIQFLPIEQMIRADTDGKLNWN